MLCYKLLMLKYFVFPFYILERKVVGIYTYYVILRLHILSGANHQA